MRIWALMLLLAAPGWAAEQTVTWTGWFADAKCHGAVKAGEKITAINPDCARTCIEKGAAPVFLSEQAKAGFLVKDYAGVLDDLGYHVEIHGVLDNATKTVSIREVKHMEYAGAACSRPRKK